MRFVLFLAACVLAAACDRPGPSANAGATVVSEADAHAAPVGPDVSQPSTAGAPRAVDGELERLQIELGQREERILELEAIVKAQSEQRVEREQEWLEYTQSIARLSSIAGLQDARFEPMLDPPGAPAEPTSDEAKAPIASSDPADEAELALRRRDAEIRTSLRALLIAEQVSGFDVLETGRLADGAVGPVVVRVTDERGRALGTLCAERLRLEASVAARSVTLVLEDGYERRGSERFPFPPVAADPLAPAPPSPSREEPPVRSGRRRIELPHIDPRPWIEALPELFRAADREPPPDDGLWNLLGVRAALNLLLRQDTTAGVWRLVGLAGVQEGVLRDVQLDQLDEDGAILRKLFADRMRVHLAERGVRIELESGAILRGDVKTPFLEGRYTIFLLRADVAEWRAAGVPGLTDAPPRR